MNHRECTLAYQVREPPDNLSAAFAGLPLMDRFDADITRVIESGGRATVDPAGGLVVVRR